MSFYPAPIGSRCPVKNCKWTSNIKTEQQYADHLERKHVAEYATYCAEKATAEEEALADADDDNDDDNDDEEGVDMFDAEDAIYALKEENKRIHEQLNIIIETLAKMQMPQQVPQQVPQQIPRQQSSPYMTPVKNPFMSAVKNPFMPSAVMHPPPSDAKPLMQVPDVLIKSPDAPKTGTVKLVAQGELKVSANDIPIGKLLLKHDTDFTVVYKDKKDKLCYYSPVKETGEVKKRMCTQTQTTADRLLPLTDTDLQILGYNTKG